MIYIYIYIYHNAVTISGGENVHTGFGKIQAYK